MAIRNLRYEGDEILSKRAREIENIDEKINELAQDMMETMHKFDGVGLAAPQVGILKRLIVIDLYEEGTQYTLINPVIIKEKGEQLVDEGCLSFPNKFGKVKRPKEVVVEALDINGKKVKIKAKDFFDRNIGNVQIMCLEPKSVTDTPRNITGLLQKNIDKFIHLQDRKTQNPIKLNNKGIVLTEKIARDLGVKAGDEIELINSDDKKAKIKVSHITENYISHYAYISPENYIKLFEKDLDFNRLIGILNNPSVKIEDKLSKKLFDIETIDGITFNTASKETFHNTIKNLNYVVLIMIISAGALAFVVLYNLTNVNISERIREIATIKVLGFYDKEVSAYIYRENIILTIIGTVVGLGLGTILHKFIMVTVEIQSMMFGRVIDISSYFIAAVLTIVLSLFVNLAMFYKLRNVKMVESLKSVD